MRPLYLLAAAGAAWWYLTRPTASPAALEAPDPYKATGPQTEKGGAGTFAPGDVLTIDGRKWRVAGAATPAGLVPVAAVSEPGALTAAVLHWYDPRTRRVVSGVSYML